VLQSPPPSPPSPPEGGDAADEHDGEARPPWHWVGFGTIATFALWLPLAYAAEALRHRLFLARFGAAASREEVTAAFAAMSDRQRLLWTTTQTLPHLAAFAAGAFAGGLLVGRFGKGVGLRESALSGVLTALVALAVSWRVIAEGGAFAAVSVVVPLVVAVGFAALGGRVGATKRAREP
jgi:tRNA-(ms[2]io[6]A)-hydroxylase